MDPLVPRNNFLGKRGTNNMEQKKRKKRACISLRLIYLVAGYLAEEKFTRNPNPRSESAAENKTLFAPLN